jgi:hypothetical protein
MISKFSSSDTYPKTAEYFILRALLHIDLCCLGHNYDLNIRLAIDILKQGLECFLGDFLIRLLYTIVLVYSGIFSSDIFNIMRIGAIFSALEVFKKLDIKQIQIDTLSYIISDHLINIGDFADSEAFYHESFFLYDDNRTQTLEVMNECFLTGKYSRIREFYELFTRLEHSIQSIACILETIRSQILLSSLGDLKVYLSNLRSEELFFDGTVIFIINILIIRSDAEEDIRQPRY